MRFLVLLSAIIFFQSCCRQREKITANLIYETINELILQDSLNAYTICREPGNMHIPGNIQNSFFNGDAHFLQWQMKHPVISSFDTGRLKYYSFKKAALTTATISADCTASYTYSYSLPVFSHNLNTMAIKVSCNEPGFLSGWTNCCVYRRSNGRWIKIKNIFTIIS